MLFDLRSPGRRRTIKFIYGGLAVLLFVGLVGSGIGSAASGGLFDALGGCNSNDPASAFEKDVKQAEKRVAAQPRNAQAWAALARVRYQDAASGSDQQTGEFSAEGRKKLPRVEQAWNRYLALQPEKRDPNLARLMVQAFIQLNKAGDAVKTQQIVTEAMPNADSFYQLAVYAYSAGQARTGDLASQRALDLTAKDLRPSLQERIDEAKQSAAGAPVGAPAGGAAPPPSG